MRGSPWALGDALRAFAAMSRTVPERPFEIVFEPDGAEGTLHDGVYVDVPADEVAAWTAQWPRPHVTPIAGATIRCTPPTPAGLDLEGTAVESDALATRARVAPGGPVAAVFQQMGNVSGAAR